MRDFRHFGKVGVAIVSIGSFFAASQALADFVINDDLIVDGSACIGFDCVNGESFGFDTIRLKENNLRIKFDDTSVAASFPRNDWQILVNDSANGGQSKFSIEDVTGGRTPFTIEANARSHSLYVDDGGRIGIRTSTPATELHIIDGDTPTVRLQQDGSSGFAPQTWDVAGNETNFFIRDVTNGSTLPIRVRPGAPSNAVFVDVDGDVGMGTSSPDSALHVLHTDNANTTVTLENTNASIGRSWQMVLRATDGEFAINDPDTSGADFIFRAGSSGGLTIQGDLVTGSGGNCASPNPPCDRVFADGAEIPTIDDHAREMWENMYLPAVGPTRPNEPINVTRTLTRMLNELEKAHIYIAELHQRIARLEDAASHP